MMENVQQRACITRMAPGNQQLRFDVAWDAQPARAEALVTRLDTGAETVFPLLAGQSAQCLSPLWNDVDYRLTVLADGAAACPPRLFRLGYVPGVVVNYIHPEDTAFMPSGRSTGAPSLLRLPDGRLLASHNCFWGGAQQNLTLIFQSDDRGVTWRYLSRVSPCTWGALFYHRGRVYMLGVGGEYGALLLFCSEDGGAHFSAPTELLPAGDRERGGPHKAPMPVIEHKGRLWTAIDHGSWTNADYHRNGFIIVSVDDDLMDAKKWTCTGFLCYNSSWSGAPRGHSRGCLEGNAVVTPDGRLVNFLRYEITDCAPEKGLAVLLEADASAPGEMPSFYKIVRFPGGSSKFKVGYDPQSHRYWALVSRCVSENLKQRNLLTLVSSPDLESWRIERDVLNYQDNGWPEDSGKVAFQYADWLVDGPDLLVLSRTSINGAYNYHNANHLTFHRVYNFRDIGY